jgi:hypothetical protein
LPIPAGILRIPVFSAPVAFFSEESQFLFSCNFFGTPSGNLPVWGLRRYLCRNLKKNYLSCAYFKLQPAAHLSHHNKMNHKQSRSGNTIISSTTSNTSINKEDNNIPIGLVIQFPYDYNEACALFAAEASLGHISLQFSRTCTHWPCTCTPIVHTSTNWLCPHTHIMLIFTIFKTSNNTTPRLHWGSPTTQRKQQHE